MIVQFEDKEYNFDIEALDLAQARHIKRQTGLSVKGLLDGLAELDPEACVALYWLMLKQNGTATDMNKVNFPILKFGEAIIAAFQAEEEKEAEADPTEAEAEPNPA